MRALLAALRCEKGDIAGNLAAHLRLLAEARSSGCDLALFPEMSLTGSADPATHPERLISFDHPAVRQLAAATGETGVAACFGMAERSRAGEPHITQVVASHGGLLGYQRKRYLGEGEEAFTAATTTGAFGLAGACFGVAICAEAGFDAPFNEAVAAGAGVMLFPAAPGLHGRRTDEASWRRGFAWWEESSLGDARRHARRLGLWVALAGQAGSTIDEDFPGLAGLVAPDGSVTARLPDWREGVLVTDIG
ncbi:MAG TPA: carbon-nitrogen hydrolase family protein [Streptosporangiaceae bacterium]